jgi:hypothetical protein
MNVNICPSCYSNEQYFLCIISAEEFIAKYMVSLNATANNYAKKPSICFYIKIC